MESAKDICERIGTNIEKVIRGQSAAIRKIIGAFASGDDGLQRERGVPKLGRVVALHLCPELGWVEVARHEARLGDGVASAFMRAANFRAGAVDTAPILIGVVPFGVIAGVAAVGAGFSNLQAILSSSMTASSGVGISGSARASWTAPRPS